MSGARSVGTTMACLVAMALGPATVQGQSGIERALERAGEAVERAMVNVGRAVERTFDQVRPEVAWSQEADAFEWRGTLAAGRILEVKGVNGGITVERASGGEAEVVATARGRRSDPSEVRVEMVEHDEGLTFCAVYPTPDGERQNYCAPGDEGHMNVRRNDVEVNFTVRLPEGVRFSGRTVNGEVEGRDLASDVTLRTVNGDVGVSTTGYAEARTVNGSIDARMGRMDDEGGLRFATVNGSIDLDLPDDADADLDASWVNGGLETDLPFQVRGRIGRRSARGVLGEGGPRLELSTVNGTIRLR